MWRMLTAPVVGLALFGGPSGHASTTEEIVALFRDVCVEHGANRSSMATIAQERAWRALSRAELDALPMRGIRPGFIAGWVVSDGPASIRIILSANGVISAGMRERAAAGERVTAPPPGEAALDATVQDRLLQREPTQECTLRFSGLNQTEFADVGRAMAAMELFGRALGEPGLAQDVSRGLPPGERAFNIFWGVGPTPTTRWLAINYTIHDTQGTMRAQVSVNQPVSERTPQESR